MTTPLSFLHSQARIAPREIVRAGIGAWLGISPDGRVRRLAVRHPREPARAAACDHRRPPACGGDRRYVREIHSRADARLLVLAGLAYNNLTGRAYPHRAHPMPRPIPMLLTEADFEGAITDYGKPLAISDDLGALYNDLVRRALAR